MRLALLGDLHGNMAALEAVAADITRRGADAIYCLGDMVGKGPHSPETMDWALAHCDVALMGNWDEFVCLNQDLPVAAWYRAQLGAARCQKLLALPLEHRFALAGRRFRLLHGRPVTPGTVYSDSPRAAREALFQTDDGYVPDIVGFADIHRPFYEHLSPFGVLFNTGSVGNPLGAQPYASYLILEGELGEAVGPLTYTLVQLPYDREKAIQQARAVPDLPSLDAFLNELRTGNYSR